MGDSLPTVDFDFIDVQIRASSQFNKAIVVGRTIAYLKGGTSPIFKRFSSVFRSVDDQVSFQQATGLAVKFGFLPALIDWLENRRDFKDGGKFVR